MARIPTTVLPQTAVQAVEAEGVVVTTLVDEEIVGEVTTGIIGMTITTRRVRSLVASRR